MRMRMKMRDGVYSREEYIVFSSTSHAIGPITFISTPVHSQVD